MANQATKYVIRDPTTFPDRYVDDMTLNGKNVQTTTKVSQAAEVSENLAKAATQYLGNKWEPVPVENVK